MSNPAQSRLAVSKKPKGIYLLSSSSYGLIYGAAEREQINQMVDIIAPPQTAETIAESYDVLAEVEIIISGWGMAVMDGNFLNSTPNLKAIFYGAGSIKGIVTDAFWERGILISSAYAANAIPVAEFTLSQILYSLKRGWYFVRTVKKRGEYPTIEPGPGGYGSTVGLISLGMIGRRVARLLKGFEVKVLAYDPFCLPDDAAELNVELCTLEEIFERSDVVSLHTPWLKETEGLITGAHLASMRPGATFINTARGAIVREAEMIEVLQKRPDLFAVLDVTYPEPPLAGSPLYKLFNVVLTPHIAGAQGHECLRMGGLMVEELKRYLRGDPLQWALSREKAAILA